MSHPMLPDDQELRDLVNAEHLGRQIEQFRKTEVWRYLLARAERERDDAIAALVVCPAQDADRIRNLQSAIQRAESLDAWLDEAIANGEVATKQLNEAQREENA